MKITQKQVETFIERLKTETADEGTHVQTILSAFKSDVGKECMLNLILGGINMPSYLTGFTLGIEFCESLLEIQELQKLV